MRVITITSLYLFRYLHFYGNNYSQPVLYYFINCSIKEANNQCEKVNFKAISHF